MEIILVKRHHLLQLWKKMVVIAQKPVQFLTALDKNTVRHLDATWFTAKQEALFERWFEEGCDIFIDKEYIEWLKINHPAFHLTDNSSNETADDPCGQPATSTDRSKDQITSNVVCDNVSGPTSSLFDLLVCPTINNLISDVLKRPPTCMSMTSN